MARDIQLEIDPAPIRKAVENAGRAAKMAIGPSISEALTVIALRARKAEIENMQEVLDNPTPFALRSIVANGAKRHPDGSLQSNIYVRAAMLGILLRLEYGGTVEAGLAIIDATLENQYGSLGQGGIRRLLRMPGTFEGAIGGQRGVYQRDPITGKLKLLVAYIDGAEYKPQLGYNDVAKRVGKDFMKEVQRQMTRRMKEAGYA